MSFQSPAEARKKYAAEKAKRDEEYNKANRLPEAENTPGRITKLNTELSRAKNEMYVVTIQTDGNPDENGKRKKIDIKKNICKHLDFHMDEFHDMIEKAGFDLEKITTPEEMDEVLDTFAEELPRITFACKHQKDNAYNNYEIQTVDVIAPDHLAKAVEGVGEGSKGGSSKGGAVGYTVADIKEMEKADLEEVAEELNVTLTGKTKSKMQKELIAFIESNTPESTPEDSAGSEEESILPDED